MLDREPVSERAFARFLATHTEWSRERVAVPGYLAGMRNQSAAAHLPVTSVTQAAAAAYCSAQGMRLPSEAEWEYAAGASENMRDGSRDPSFKQKLLALYTRPRGTTRGTIGSTFRNALGVSDMHGLVWEWVAPEPMQMTMHAHHDLSCAGSANGAHDPADFPAFLRYAYRSGLTSRSVGPNLGFRCAASL
jgi:formylglycine-generating enzyme required for sulfatase activity